MKNVRAVLGVIVGVLAIAGAAMGQGASVVPFASGERLRYEIVWPSGLRLGDAEFLANSNQAGWAFSADISANLPAIVVQDKYQSSTDFSLCSTRFAKQVTHGRRNQNEEVEFDQSANTALRKNLADSTTQDLVVPPCVRDALAYLYYLRQDLSHGRVPPPDDFNFGPQMQVSVSYVETRKIESRGVMQDADRLLIYVTGGEKPINIEVFLAKDEARTPLLLRAPFELGTFSLRLVE